MRAPAPGTFTVSAPSARVVENAGDATVEIIRTGGSEGFQTIAYDTRSGSALDGFDYHAVKGTLTFADGETSKSISIPLIDDAVGETDESFTFTISSPSGTIIGSPASAAITIADDDLPAVTIFDANALEGDTGLTTVAVPLRLSVPSAAVVAVSYSMTRGTTSDDDFIASTGTVTFEPGETSKSIPILVRGDNVPEDDEFFDVDITKVTNCVTANGRAKVMILNDDIPYRRISDVVYATVGGNDLHLDMYLPPVPVAAAPVIIWIHDDWTSGTKARPLIVREAARGYAVVSIEYRLTSTATFPAQINDCKAAIQWIRAHAQEYGFDPDRIAVWGFGEGGTLAAIVALDGNSQLVDIAEAPVLPPLSSRVMAAVIESAPSDLLAWSNERSCDEPRDPFDSPEARLIGCDVASCWSKAAAACPITYAGGGDDASLLIMHGATDCIVSPLQARVLDMALRDAGSESTLMIAPNVGHDSAFWVSEAIDQGERFLDEKVKGVIGKRHGTR
jgi:acetyl esterase/lipase